jgi:predicted CopG family antitoxin
MLSDEIQKLEEEVIRLRTVVNYTQQVLSTFITNYHSKNNENLFSKNRNFHTVSLEDVLKIINKNLNNEYSTRL